MFDKRARGVQLRGRHLRSFRDVVCVSLCARPDAQLRRAWLEISDDREALQACECSRIPVAPAVASTLVENPFLPYLSSTLFVRIERDAIASGNEVSNFLLLNEEREMVFTVSRLYF